MRLLWATHTKPAPAADPAHAGMEVFTPES